MTFHVELAKTKVDIEVRINICLYSECDNRSECKNEQDTFHCEWVIV